MKHGKKTLWLRMFRKEVKEAVATFYSSKDLQKFCGIDPYDKDSNPNGNFKQNGRVFYYRPKPNMPWRWFLKVYTLGDNDAARGADDVDVDTLVFDEYTKTKEKYNRYRGNIVNDFLDIWHSAKREHSVRCILLGNKESVINPFFVYFGINPPPSDWEGIRAYRNGAFILQQINNLPEGKTDFDRKTEALLSGTAYGNYIYKSEYKAATGLKTRKTPATASLYVQLNIKATPLKISFLNGYFYVNRRIDTSKAVYCDVLPHRYKRERLLVRRQKRFFGGFVEALANNSVYYDNEATLEALQPFLQWLNV